MNSKTAVQRINWRQAIAEVAMIVAGILIALAVDNWWDAKLERDAEHGYLEALRQDFQTNRESLKSQIEIHENLIIQGDEILKLIQAGLNDESSKELFSKVNNSFYFFRNWIPVTGTYDDIINSGRLLYIENQQLRNELSGFRRTLESIREYEGLQTKTFYENQSPFLTKNQDVNYSTWSGDYRPPISPFSVEISPFATVEYWNLVIQWIFVHADVISNYRRGIAHCDRILELIDIELASKRQ